MRRDRAREGCSWPSAFAAERTASATEAHPGRREDGEGPRVRRPAEDEGGVKIDPCDPRAGVVRVDDPGRDVGAKAVARGRGPIDHGALAAVESAGARERLDRDRTSAQNVAQLWAEVRVVRPIAEHGRRAEGGN